VIIQGEKHAIKHATKSPLNATIGPNQRKNIVPQPLAPPIDQSFAASKESKDKNEESTVKSQSTITVKGRETVVHSSIPSAQGRASSELTSLSSQLARFTQDFKSSSASKVLIDIRLRQ
jgi:hypothetical protein